MSEATLESSLPKSASYFGDDTLLDTIPEATPEQEDGARRFVALRLDGEARDEVLALLGLTDPTAELGS